MTKADPTNTGPLGLEPCPFCGGEAMECHISEPTVMCTNCPVGMVGEDEAEAIENWNTRPARAEAPPVHEGVCSKCKGRGYIEHEGGDSTKSVVEYEDCPACASPSRPVVGGEGSLASGVPSLEVADHGLLEAVALAASNVLIQRFSTYRAKNGRDVGVEDADGEKVWLVPFAVMFDLDAAIAALPPALPPRRTDPPQLDAEERS